MFDKENHGKLPMCICEEVGGGEGGERGGGGEGGRGGWRIEIM